MQRRSERAPEVKGLKAKAQPVTSDIEKKKEPELNPIQEAPESVAAPAGEQKPDYQYQRGSESSKENPVQDSGPSPNPDKGEEEPAVGA